MSEEIKWLAKQLSEMSYRVDDGTEPNEGAATELYNRGVGRRAPTVSEEMVERALKFMPACSSCKTDDDPKTACETCKYRMRAALAAALERQEENEAAPDKEVYITGHRGDRVEEPTEEQIEEDSASLSEHENLWEFENR